MNIIIWLCHHILCLQSKTFTPCNWIILSSNKRGHFSCQDGLWTRELCQSQIPIHCCNSQMFHGSSPRCYPYTTICQLCGTWRWSLVHWVALGSWSHYCWTWALLAALESPSKQMGFFSDASELDFREPSRAELAIFKNRAKYELNFFSKATIFVSKII